jgi:peptidoglycan/LPS O-acetylase OafA/YrhL
VVSVDKKFALQARKNTFLKPRFQKNSMNNLVKPEAFYSGRLYHLDALRGIAALSVAIGHVFGTVPKFESWTVMLGRPSVTFFFLLSGYVLGKSLEKNMTYPVVGYACYSVRRFLRLYPAIFITVIIAAIFAKFYIIPDPSLNIGSWFRKSIMKATTIHTLHEYIGSFRVYYLRLNPVLWTIQIEFVCSFLLPFLVWPSKWRPFLKWILLSVLGYCKFTHPSWLGMGSFLFEFYLGYIAWTLSPTIAKIGTKLSKWLIPIAFICVLSWMWFLDRSGVGFVSICSIAVLLALLGPCQWDGLKSVLQAKQLQFLGKISYSFYLIHLPVLIICWSMIWGRCGITMVGLGQAAILLITMLPISFLLANAIERFVERPFNNLGHRFSRWLVQAVITQFGKNNESYGNNC